MPFNARLSQLACISSVVCLLLSHAAKADEIKVAVAANFHPTLSVIAQHFEKASQHKVILVSGSSGKLLAQIVNGAPYSLFFSADTAKPKYLEDYGFITPHSRKTYATGQLVFHAPQTKKGSTAKDELLSQKGVAKIQRIAIANPRHAPYGAAAIETLKSLNLYETYIHQLVSGENVAHAYNFVKSGNVDGGFIALSHIIQTGPIDHRTWVIPAGLYTPIEQQRVILKGTKNMHVVESFLEYLQSPASQTLIQSHGYLLTPYEALP